MTSAIVHGDPGSYKTASLLVDFLVPALSQGRTIITNIRGVKSKEQIASAFKVKKLHPDTKIILVPFNKEGFRLMATFFHWAPMGALILMDEGQRIFPTRMKNLSYLDAPPTDDRPYTVEDAFDSHRHMNWDIYVSTTNIAKIHKEIRQVAEFGYRHKNMATVFSFMRGWYKRVVHNAETSGISVSNQISSRLCRINTKVYEIYDSTKTGKTKDTSSSVNIFKQPKFILLLLIIIYSCCNMYSTISAAGGVPTLLGGTPKNSTVSAPAKVDEVHSPSPARFSSGDAPKRIRNQDPFSDAVIYFAGYYGNKVQFVVERSPDDFIYLTLEELMKLGYQVNQLSRDLFKFSTETETFYVHTRPRPTPPPVSVRDPLDVSG